MVLLADKEHKRSWIDGIKRHDTCTKSKSVVAILVSGVGPMDPVIGERVKYAFIFKPLFCLYFYTRAKLLKLEDAE